MIPADAVSWTDQVQAYASVFSAVVAVVSAALSALFLWYTVKTFREIRRQTELQVEAFVVVIATVVPRPNDTLPLAAEISALHDKWFEILDKNLPAATQVDNRYLQLKLINRGRSDVVSWKLRMHIEIEPGAVLATRNIIGERQGWLVESEGSQHLIAPSSEIEVIVAQLGIFPVANVSWTLAYTDSRKCESQYFAGDSRKRDVNAFAAGPSVRSPRREL